MNNTPVAIVMGSKSDLDIVQGAFDILDKFGVKFTARVLSAHRTPAEAAEFAATAEEKGYKVIYIGLYGSQNYNLDDEESDIDVKAIIMPTLHDIIFRKVTSATIECEKGNIDVKDLITFYDVIKKGNFSYIESIQTKYSIGDKYIKELFSQFKVNKKSMLGAMYEKRKALMPIANTYSLKVPYLNALGPPEESAIPPPTVDTAKFDGSGGKYTPLDSTNFCKSPTTTPG